MNVEQEIEKLKAADLTQQGEAIAAQAVIIGLCQAIIASNPEARGVVTDAFDYADRFAEIGAMHLGAKQAPAHLLGFMQTLEQMRKAALGSHSGPQGGV
jgi:hypothetical protein